jgi:hypothetical protein
MTEQTAAAITYQCSLLYSSDLQSINFFHGVLSQSSNSTSKHDTGVANTKGTANAGFCELMVHPMYPRTLPPKLQNMFAITAGKTACNGVRHLKLLTSWRKSNKCLIYKYNKETTRMNTILSELVIHEILDRQLRSG